MVKLIGKTLMNIGAASRGPVTLVLDRVDLYVLLWCSVALIQQWPLGDMTSVCWTYDQEVLRSTPGQATIDGYY